MKPDLRPVRTPAHPPAVLTDAELRFVDFLAELALDAWERDRQPVANESPSRERDAG